MKKLVRITPHALALVFLLILWGACKKSSSSTNTTERMKFVTQSPWKYDTAGADLDRNGTIDIGDETILPCYRDNTYLFNKDSTGLADEGATKCDGSDSQSFPFTWSFGTTGQSTIKSSSDPRLAEGINIYSVSDTKFVLYKDTTVLGVQIWYILSLKH